MNEPQAIALFYLIPIALWLALLGILFRVWWSHTLEDGLAYLVFLRERKVLFVSLLAGLTILHVIVEVVNIGFVLGWFAGLSVLTFGLAASVIGSVLVFLFGWVLLRGAGPTSPRPAVLDGPEHLAYTVGLVDRAEAAQASRRESGLRSPGAQGTLAPNPGLLPPPYPVADERASGPLH